jgi:hypothetical protein
MSGLLLAAVLAVSASAQTEVRLALTGQGGQPAPGLALPAFDAEDPAKGEHSLFAKRLRDVVRGDLMASRHFDVKDEEPGALPAPGATWRLRAKAGITGAKLSVQVTLANASGGETVFERFYRQDAQWERALAHRIADDVVKAATGRDGIARSRIAFANSQTGSKEIYVMDYDGENVKRLTDHRSISLLPRFSPDGRRLAYTSYKGGNPDLYLLDLETGRAKEVSGDQGLNIAGGFSPDGKKLLMTLSRQKSPNLYLKDLPFRRGLHAHFLARLAPGRLRLRPLRQPADPRARARHQEDPPPHHPELVRRARLVAHGRVDRLLGPRPQPRQDGHLPRGHHRLEPAPAHHGPGLQRGPRLVPRRALPHLHLHARRPFAGLRHGLRRLRPPPGRRRPRRLLHAPLVQPGPLK